MWVPRVWRTSAIFTPIAEAASLFDAFDEWPSLDDYRRLEDRAGVRFVRCAPKARRNRSARPPYDLHVAQGEVPTRERSLHDFFNALVFASFPRAKRALHARQLEARARRALVHARSREEDRLTMLDEGSVLVRAGELVVFGHAVYEHLAEQRGPVRAMRVEGAEGDVDEWLAREIQRVAWEASAHETVTLYHREP